MVFKRFSTRNVVFSFEYCTIILVFLFPGGVREISPGQRKGCFGQSSFTARATVNSPISELKKPIMMKECWGQVSEFTRLRRCILGQAPSSSGDIYTRKRVEQQVVSY